MNCDQKKLYDFLKDLNIDNDIKMYILEEYKKHIEPKQKKKMSSYILFSLDEREKLRKKDPPVTKRNEVSKLISSRWNDIKNQNTDEYKYYINLSEQSSLTDNNNPFHKFSVDHRENIKKSYPDKNAFEITFLLKKKWFELSVEEKNMYID